MRIPDRSHSIVLVGLQGAGKSTLARGFFGESHLRLNLDMLRTRHREALLLEACLTSKTPFVIDNTNLTRVERARYVDAARDRATLAVIWIDTPMETALARNRERDAKACVPEHVIVGGSRRLEPPTCAEGFVRVWRLTHDESVWEIVEETETP